MTVTIKPIEVGQHVCRSCGATAYYVSVETVDGRPDLDRQYPLCAEHATEGQHVEDVEYEVDTFAGLEAIHTVRVNCACGRFTACEVVEPEGAARDAQIATMRAWLRESHA